MSETTLQLTLREMKAFFTSPRSLGGLVVVALILGVSGPFQTYDVLPLAPRMAYWALMTGLTFAVGNFAGTYVSIATDDWQRLRWLRRMLIGSAAGLPVMLVVFLVNGWVLKQNMPLADMAALAFYCVVISIAISMLHGIFGPTNNSTPATGVAALLQRLPLQMRGALVSLSVQDHYVEVTTAKGKSLVLMRLSDAIAETGGIAGLQVHRSHWVALDGVSAVHRRDGKVNIVTSAGAELPVSRTYVGAVKAAGLL